MSLIRQLILEEVSEKKKDIIKNNIRKRLYKIFKHEGHLEQVISFPHGEKIESDEVRESNIKSNILVYVNPITEELIEIDPTDNGQYLTWLYSVFIKNDHYLPTHPDKLVHPSDTLKKIREDGDRVKHYLKLFDGNKAQIKRQDQSVNINDYDSPQELLQVVEQFRSQTEEGELIITKDYVENNFDEDEAEVFFENDEWIITIPKTRRASCMLGVDSEWCTTYGEESPREDKRSRRSMFSSYANDPLFILQNKNNHEELLQFSFESGEFMDKYDSPIDATEFMGQNPEVQDAFHDKGYYLDKMTRIVHLIDNEDFDKAVEEINGLGYGYIGVQEVDHSEMVTTDDVDQISEDIIEELFDVDISDTFYLSEFLSETLDSFMAVTYHSINIENVIPQLTTHEKENIISNTLDKHGDQVENNINFNLPTDDLFIEVFKYINNKESLVPNEIDLTSEHIDDALYNNLQEYIEDVVEYMGFRRMEDNNYYFVLWYDLYDPSVLEYYLQDRYADDELYEALGRIDEIKDEVDVQLDDSIIKNINDIGDIEIEFEDFEEFIIYVTTKDKNVLGLDEVRNALQLKGYLDSNVIPVDDPDQMELQLEQSLLKYFLK